MSSRHNTLSSAQLYKKCDLSDLNFTSTDDLPVLDEILGQQRAVTAIKFGMGIDHKGYNLFVLGSEGIGKTALIKKLLKKHYVRQKKPFDWCYVNNFEYPQHPRLLRLPAGTAKPFSESMEKLIKSISSLISSTFQSDEYTTQVQAIENAINEQGDKLINDLIDQAGRRTAYVTIRMLDIDTNDVISVTDFSVPMGQDAQVLLKSRRTGTEMSGQ